MMTGLLRSMGLRPQFLTVYRLLTVYGLMLALSGCGYVVGNPYRPEVRTVSVPIFTNEAYKSSFNGGGYRTGIETQLTEAVQKQIQLKTHFRLANDDMADTRLVGRIVSFDKRLANQNKFDDARELELTMGVEVIWENSRTGEILAQRSVPISAHLAHSVVNTSYAPEAGQSLQTATADACTQMARQIVGMMETPW